MLEYSAKCIDVELERKFMEDNLLNFKIQNTPTSKRSVSIMKEKVSDQVTAFTKVFKNIEILPLNRSNRSEKSPFVHTLSI